MFFSSISFKYFNSLRTGATLLPDRSAENIQRNGLSCLEKGGIGLKCKSTQMDNNVLREETERSELKGISEVEYLSLAYESP